MRVLGIDYSINCAGCCLIEDNTIRWFVNYRKDGKDYPVLPNSVIEWRHSTIEDHTDRFIELSLWANDIIGEFCPDIVILEDFAFSAKGNITALAENVGIFKADFRRRFPTKKIELVAPTKMKKMATGKGNSNKDAIWESFVKIFPIYSEWPKIIHPKGNKIGSPIADIADSYFLAVYGETNYGNTNIPNNSSTSKT